jgi:outer membrane protein W
MKTSGIAAGALAFATATSAFAQITPANPPPPTLGEASRDVADVLTAPVRAPKRAYELGVEAGYTQGFGSATSDRRVGAGPGGTVGVSAGYRVDPRWAVGMGAQYQGYSGTQANAGTLRGVTADVHGTYHLSPYNRVDPYVTFGAGYRLFTQTPAGNAKATLTHALELGKVEFGVDVRPSESVAISPVVGVDLNLFMWRAGAPVETASLTTRAVNAFVFAGVKGRFDLGGTRESKPAP